MGQITQVKKYLFSLTSGVVYPSPLPFNNHNSNPLLISYPQLEKAEGVLFCFYSNKMPSLKNTERNNRIRKVAALSGNLIYNSKISL